MLPPGFGFVTDRKLPGTADVPGCGFVTERNRSGTALVVGEDVGAAVCGDVE